MVLIVWDGMRPDFATAEHAPTLGALARQGTFFTRHHSVYVTSTEVNCATISTGCYPNHNGVIGNREYRPDLNLIRPIGTESLLYMRLGDALSDGKFLSVPTIPEILATAGFPTMVAGSKPVVSLMNRSLPRAGAPAGSILLSAGMTLPMSALGEIEAALGPLPLPSTDLFAPFSFTPQDKWTASALTEVLWKDGLPKYSVLWLGNPDLTQHPFGPGSPEALDAIAGDDARLADVLAALDRKGVRQSTDLFIVSDHGFSTVARTVDTMGLLKKAGSEVVREFRQTPKPGEILAVNLGGSLMLYIPDHDRGIEQRLVDYLQGTDFAGPIFTRDALAGTFTFNEARIDTPNAPDVMFSYRWTNARNQFGVAGSLISEAVLARRAGFGTHASLSPFDFHNTLVAAGPDIRAGFADELPSANVDLAPTILHLLGLHPPQPMDGRILAEALNEPGPSSPAPEEKKVEASRKLGNGTWRQYLKETALGEHLYLDEGNAEKSSE